MKVSCSQCGTSYRVDPEKVPVGGIRARCATCAQVFRVERAGEPPVTVAPAPAEAPALIQAPLGSETGPARAESPASSGEPGTASGGADPQARARRLARALVSDIVAYHTERRERSLATGTLRQEFREEIRRSWDDYVAQVGGSVARDTPYFREALNEILAGGRNVF